MYFGDVLEWCDDLYSMFSSILCRSQDLDSLLSLRGVSHRMYRCFDRAQLILNSESEKGGQCVRVETSLGGRQIVIKFDKDYPGQVLIRNIIGRGYYHYIATEIDVSHIQRVSAYVRLWKLLLRNTNIMSIYLMCDNT